MRHLNRWPLYLLLFALVVLGTRLAWRLSVMDEGWSTQLDQWVDVAVNLCGVNRRKIDQQDPADQARHWLREVQSISAANHKPAVMMGAAWMLDSPQTGFIARHVRTNKTIKSMDFPEIPAHRRLELDAETISAKVEEYESLCAKECVARIKKAIDIDDADVELRRAYALLMFHTGFMRLASEPRQNDWLNVCNQCAKADPGNALYDYLAAVQLWESSAEYRWTQDGYVVNIKDIKQFDEGNKLLASGLEKSHLRFGTKGYAATLAFLEATSTLRSDRLKAARSRGIDDRATGLLIRIMRWGRAQCDVHRRAGRLEQAHDAAQRVRAIAEQVTGSGNSPTILPIKLALREWSLAQTECLQADHPDLLSTAEMKRVSDQLADIQRDVRVHREVSRRRDAKERSSNETATQTVVSALLIVAAQMLVIACVPFGLFAFLVSVLLGRAGDTVPVEFGWGRHFAAWLLAVGVSFVLLGMFPAKLISASVQTGLLQCAVWLAFGGVLLGALLLFSKLSQFPFDQLTALAIVAVIPMVAIIYSERFMTLAIAVTAALHPILSIALILIHLLICWAAIRLLYSFVATQKLTRLRKVLGVITLVPLMWGAVVAGDELGRRIPGIESQAWFPLTVVDGAPFRVHNIEELQDLVKPVVSRWVWALIQWHVNHGPLVASLSAIVLVLIWKLIRCVRKTEGGLAHIIYSSKQIILRELGLSVASTCLVVSLICLVLYCGALAPVVDRIDSRYRIECTRMLQPEKAWQEVSELTAEVKADPETMAMLQREIDETKRQISEQGLKN